MNVLFFIFVSLFLFIIQTVVLPNLPIFPYCFDFLFIEILFLSLVFEHVSVLAGIFLIGLVMDSLSGVPFFYHIFSYLWVYVLVHLAKQLVFKQSVVFIFIIAALSVFIQQGFFLFSVYVRPGTQALSGVEMTRMMYQILLGALLIPVGIKILSISFSIWKQQIEQLQKVIAKHFEDEIE